MKKITSTSAEETIRIAQDFAKSLKPGAIVFLKGDLGAGKTTFVKGIAKGLNVNPREVNSPTFVLMNFYDGKMPMYHFDLYRLEKPQEIASMNLDEYFYGDGVSLIEWPERLGVLAPEKYTVVELSHVNETQRTICIA